jgi:hypothetical protein
MQFGRGKPSAGAFFDSDFTNIDSLLAVAVLYGLQGKNDCRVAVVASSRPDLATVGFIDAVQRYYHGPVRSFFQSTPVAMRTEGTAGTTPRAFVAPFDRKKADGTALYANQVKTVIDTADPNTIYRNYLEAQYDKNAFFVLAGPATNLAAALEFRGTKELIAAKIKYLVVASTMGQFQADLPAARKVLADWPTPVIVVGNEIGAGVEFPGASIDKEFAAANPENPVADAYRAWDPKLSNTRAFAMSAALYAGRPKEGYFQTSDPFEITVNDDGRLNMKADEKGRGQYLKISDAQKDKIVPTLVELASAKPVIRMRFRPDAVADAADKKADPAAKAAEPEKK